MRPAQQFAEQRAGLVPGTQNQKEGQPQNSSAFWCLLNPELCLTGFNAGVLPAADIENHSTACLVLRTSWETMDFFSVSSLTMVDTTDMNPRFCNVITSSFHPKTPRQNPPRILQPQTHKYTSAKKHSDAQCPRKMGIGLGIVSVYPGKFRLFTKPTGDSNMKNAPFPDEKKN